MSIQYDLRFKRIIIFILVLIMIFNFSIKPQAEAIILSGLAIKVVATILASMGILTFINSEIGIDEFYQGLLEFIEDTKGIINAMQFIQEIAVSAIYSNTKMKVTQLVNIIKDYYYSIRNSFIPKEHEWGDLPGVKAIIYNVINIKPIEHKTPTVLDYDIGNGYILRSSVEYVGGISGYWIKTHVLHNGKIIPSHDINGHATKLITTSSDDITFTYKTQLSDTLLRTDWISSNISNNKLLSGNFEKEVSPLVGLIEVPEIPDIGQIDIPEVKTVPLGLAMPWEMALANQTEIIGMTLTQLMEYIDSIPLQAYMEQLRDLPKGILDSLPQGEVITENGIITGIKEAVIPEILPDIKEQTGILGAILAFLQNLFKMPENVELDFKPFQNLALTDRFPFCLPWDLKRSFDILVAPPKPPRFEVPFVSEVIVIDLAQFESWAKISRAFSSVMFVTALIITTRKFIGGA